MKIKMIVAAIMAMSGGSVSAATLSELSGDVKVSGWISGSYLYSFNNGITQSDGARVARSNDQDTNSFLLNQAAIDLSSVKEEGFGGAVTLLAGEDARTLVNPSYGDGDSKFSVNQAYFSYAADKLKVIAGRYNSLAGYEVLADPQNSTLTRSLLYPNAQPYFHTGVRLSYDTHESATVYFGLANSAALGASRDDNKLKTVEVGALLQLTDDSTLGLYDYYGYEESFGLPHQVVNYLDLVLITKPTGALTLALNGDYLMRQDQFDVMGLAGYASYAFTPKWNATLRLEVMYVDYEDIGAPSYTVTEATLAVGYQPTPNFRLIAEGRLDTASQDLFINRYPVGAPLEAGYVPGDYKDSLPIAGVKAIYSFGL